MMERALGPSGIPAFRTAFQPTSAITLPVSFSLGERGGRRRWRDALRFMTTEWRVGAGGVAVRKSSCRPLMPAPARDCLRFANHLLPVGAGRTGDIPPQAGAVTMATHTSSNLSWGPLCHTFTCEARGGRSE